MRNINKFLSLGLVLSLTAVPVLAENAEITTSGTSQDVKVTADVSSSWEVTIPKEVLLTNPDGGSGTYTGSIPVTVKGDIGTAEVIKVDTNGVLALSDTTGANTLAVNATITKGNTEFNFAALTGGQTAETSHSVDATLTPGEWKGTLQFNINLENTTNQAPVELQAGLYDEEGNFLVSWADSGISTQAYTPMSNRADYYQSASTSGYSVLTSEYGAYKNAKRIVIPDTVISIGQYAFADCFYIRSVVLPDTLTSVGQYAFKECNQLQSITWKGVEYTTPSEFNQALRDAGVLGEFEENAWTRV